MHQPPVLQAPSFQTTAVNERAVAANNEPYIPFQDSWNSGSHTSFGAADRADEFTGPGHWNTAAAWFIAAAPLLFAVCMLFNELIVTGQIHILDLPFQGGISTVPYAAIALVYLLVVVAAAVDGAVLKRRGYARLPSMLWSLLGPLVYLIVRAVRVRSESRGGSAPLAAYIIAVVISTVFTVFTVVAFPAIGSNAFQRGTVSSASFAANVRAGLNSSGGNYTVHCPDTVTEIVGAIFTCNTVELAGASHELTIEVVAGVNGSLDLKLVSVTPPIVK